MFRIVFLSRTKGQMPETELDDILALSQHANHSENTSGLLIYTGSTFFQVIEGQKEACERLFDRIYFDKRHSRIRLLQYERVETRYFAEWAMGFCRKHPVKNASRSFFQLSERSFRMRIPMLADDELKLLMEGFATTSLADI